MYDITFPNLLLKINFGERHEDVTFLSAVNNNTGQLTHRTLREDSALNEDCSISDNKMSGCEDINDKVKGNDPIQSFTLESKTYTPKNSWIVEQISQPSTQITSTNKSPTNQIILSMSYLWNSSVINMACNGLECASNTNRSSEFSGNHSDLSSLKLMLNTRKPDINISSENSGVTINKQNISRGNGNGDIPISPETNLSCESALKLTLSTRKPDINISSENSGVTINKQNISRESGNGDIPISPETNLLSESALPKVINKKNIKTKGKKRSEISIKVDRPKRNRKPVRHITDIIVPEHMKLFPKPVRSLSSKTRKYKRNQKRK